MPRTGFILSIILTLAVAGAIPAAAIAGTGTVTGTVTTLETGEPVPGATVTVTVTLLTFTATTGSDGAFTITGIPDGVGLTLRAEADGHRAQTFAVTVRDGGTTSVECPLTSHYLRLIYPNGGEPIFAGSWVDIRWESVGVEYLTVELSLNGGDDWLLVEEHVPAAPGVYTWDVPDIPSQESVIRIREETDGGLSDMSDKPFGNTSI